MARMPRIGSSLIAVVLLSGLIQSAAVRGDERLESRRSQRQPEPQPNSPFALISIREGESLDSADVLAPAAERRRPVWLVKRSEQVSQSASRAVHGGAIPIPPARSSSDGDKPRPLDHVAAARGNMTNVVLSSLAIVLGLFFFVIWLVRRAFPKTSATLPSEVLEVLGRSPMASRHHLQLIRLGQRLLLVSVSSDGAETLTEITDTDEVNHLVGLCRENQAGSIAGTFRQVLHQLGTSQTPRSRAARSRVREQQFVLSGEPTHR